MILKSKLVHHLFEGRLLWSFTNDLIDEIL